MPDPYFFLNSVLAPNRGWVALDWQSESLAGTDFPTFIRRYAESAAAPLARVLPLVSPIQAGFVLKEEFIGAFANEPVIFVLPESCLADEQVVGRCKELRQHGWSLALQVETSESPHQARRAAFNALRFDAGFARREFSARDLNYIGNAGFRKIATRVDTYETFEWLTWKGIEWSDGHFLTTPRQRRGNAPDLSRLKLLKLLDLVRRDGDTREIEAIFREEAKLSYDLLRLVNSVAVGARVRISNFSQAIAILGRRQLQRWLQLMIYANNPAGGDAANPLMQIAAARGRQMELLGAAIDPIPDIPELTDNAFMTGLFSLLDVLIDLPMSEILKEFPLQDKVIDALTDPAGGGVLGQLLLAIAHGEAGDFASASRILSSLGINPAVHAKSQVTAFYWASRINADNHDD